MQVSDSHSHSNPISSKIRKKINKNNQSFDKFSKSKENVENNQQILQNEKEVLRQVSINISSMQPMPRRTISKLINIQTTSALNKSYSLSQLALQRESIKCSQHLKKLNEGLRQKINQTDQKIKSLSNKKQEFQSKYQRLLQKKSKNMRDCVSKLNFSNSEIPSKQQQHNNEWSSILQISCQNQQQNHHSRIPQSRIKLSQIRQKICDLDMSSLTKFAKVKGTGKRNGIV